MLGNGNRTNKSSSHTTTYMLKHENPTSDALLSITTKTHDRQKFLERKLKGEKRRPPKYDSMINLTPVPQTNIQRMNKITLTLSPTNAHTTHEQNRFNYSLEDGHAASEKDSQTQTTTLSKGKEQTQPTHYSQTQLHR